MDNSRFDDLHRRQTDLYRTQTDLYGKTITNIYDGYDTDYDTARQEDDPSAEPEKKQAQAPPAKRKKRRKKHYFLRFLGLVAAGAAVYLFLTSSIFSVDSIKVEGNTLMSDDEIIALSGVSRGDNMFQQTSRKVKKALLENQYIADVKIQRELPNIYIISITERVPVMAVARSGAYVILDEEGVAVDEADSTMHATLVTGLTINDCALGEVPEFNDSARFREASILIRKVNNSGMFFKKLEVTDNLDFKGYVTDTLIITGSGEDIADNLENIKAVLYDLNQKGIRRGLVTVGNDNYISFSPITE